MKDRNHIVFIAQDPGAASALVPIIHLQAKNSKNRLSILCRKRACALFKNEGFIISDSDKLNSKNQSWMEFAKAWLENRKVNILVSGTSFEGTFEQAFIQTANLQNICSVVVLDSWTNYRSRFLKQSGEIKNLFLPTKITLMDEFTKAEMISEGFPENMLEVLGQPAFDAQTKWFESKRGDQQYIENCRNKFNVRENQKIVAFFSQPISEMYPRGSSNFRGYTEYEVLLSLVASVKKIEKDIVVFVKLHPKEHESKYLKIKGQNPFLRIVQQNQLHLRDLILCTDICLGMTSIALVQAFIQNKKVISLQPKLIGDDSLILGRAGLLNTVTDQSRLQFELIKCFDEAIGDRANNFPEIWSDGQATQRIGALIDSLL